MTLLDTLSLPFAMGPRRLTGGRDKRTEGVISGERVHPRELSLGTRAHPEWKSLRCPAGLFYLASPV